MAGRKEARPSPSHSEGRHAGKEQAAGIFCYSANFVTDWNGVHITANPPGSRYGLVLKETELI
jgi:hypothetical protein